MILIAKYLLPIKIIGLLLLVGVLVNKGMQIERARWERALIQKNAEIAKVNTDSGKAIEVAETQRSAAIIAAAAAMSAAKMNEELLPADLVKRANDIR